MNLLPKSKTEFSQTDYWNTFFKHRGNKAFEWYGEYPHLCGFIHKYIKLKDQVLVVGCGNSKLSADLYDVGYRNLTNIDVSKVVIKQMKAVNIDRPELIFEEMDALNMSYSDGQFSVVLDKGTLDALMPDSKEETKANIDKYFEEIARVMRVGGRYVCISLLQDHLLSYLLEWFSKKGWMVRVHRCKEAEEESRNQGAALVLPVFFVICTKFINNSQLVVEVGLTDGVVSKVNSTDKVISIVRELQEVAIVCGGLRRTHTPGQEYTIDVFEPDSSTLKYKVIVVENKSVLKPTKFAAFIVPRGREKEYIYSSAEGRQEFIESLSLDRLAVIEIPPGNDIVSLEKVKEDLTELVSDISPMECTKSIPFISASCEEDTGKEVTRGTSKLSGDYIVNDVESDDGYTYRKLIFLSNSNVTQSEARMKKVKSRRGKKLVVDIGYLSCRHHILMSIGVCTVLEKESPGNILVIGLGGGSLCGYLHQCFNNSSIVAVDIDPTIVKIAKEHFHLVVDNRMDIKVADGIQFMNDSLSQGKQYDVILFDVDNKDLSMGMSCPPKEFIEASILSTVTRLLSNSGIFLLNLVCRNKKLRRDAYNKIKAEFSNPIGIQIPDELGEVLLCWKNKPTDAKKMVKDAVSQLSSIIDSNKFSHIDDLHQITGQLKPI